MVERGDESEIERAEERQFDADVRVALLRLDVIRSDVAASSRAVSGAELSLHGELVSKVADAVRQSVTIEDIDAVIFMVAGVLARWIASDVLRLRAMPVESRPVVAGPGLSRALFSGVARGGAPSSGGGVGDAPQGGPRVRSGEDEQ